MSRNSCRQCRLNAAAQWVGWHLLELAAVGVPAVLALTVSAWWVAVTVLAGALWVGHEVHLSRRDQPDSTTRAAVTAAPQPAAVTSAPDSTTETTSDSSREASA